MFKIIRPCENCPFKIGQGETFGLSFERLEEIRMAPAFQCHKTVDYSGDTPDQGDNPQQCAGLMAVLHRDGEPNQIMQVAERLKHFDPKRLDPNREAYPNWAAVLAAHGAERHIIKPKPRRVENMKRKWYIAYGSNINKSVMRVRAPGARPLGRFMLTSARLIFRGVADLEYDPNSQVPAALWSIDRWDEQALDRFEGVGSERYFKSEDLVLKWGNETRSALIYLMTSPGIYPPTQHYIDRIREGYRQFGMDESYLDAAIKHSFENKSPSEFELSRRKRQREKNERLVKFPIEVAMERLDLAKARALEPDEFEKKQNTDTTASTTKYIYAARRVKPKKQVAATKVSKPQSRPKTVKPAPKLQLTSSNSVVYGD